MSDVSFSDPVLAARLRDAMQLHIISTVNNIRPPDQIGTVEAIYPDLSKCDVQFPGAPTTVPVKLGALVPASVGVTVRVSGALGDRYVSDIYGAAVTSTPPSGYVDAPLSFDLAPGIMLVSATWEAVEGVSQYWIELADSADFTVNHRAYYTSSLEFTENNLIPGTTVYGRVSAATNGGVGTPSDVDFATVQDFPSSATMTDGIAPTTSPNPVCTSGIGYVLAQWLQIANVDPVTYEVHVSLTSGFTAGPTTKLGEVTEGTFYFVRTLADGTPLTYGANVFVRIIAKDGDGAAGQSAQAFAAPQQVNTGDAGSIAIDALSDGAIPSTSPNAPTITSGIGYLLARWTFISNNDPVMYEVHISDTSGFLPGANTLVGSTPSNYFFIRNVGSGLGGGALVYGTTYYIKIRAKDADGTQNAGTQSSGFTVQANTADIAVGAITAASAIIADAAIGTAKIQDAAITNLKVADASISTAKIQNLAVGTAQIADAAIATAKIGDLQVTTAKISGLTVDKLLAGTISGQTIILNGSTSILKSSNFVAGSAGWQIKGDGVAEFNNVTVRGALVAGGGAVNIDSDGIKLPAPAAYTGGNLTDTQAIKFVSTADNVTVSASIHGSQVGIRVQSKIPAGEFSVWLGASPTSPTLLCGPSSCSIVAPSGTIITGGVTINGGLTAQSLNISGTGNITLYGYISLAGGWVNIYPSGQIDNQKIHLFATGQIVVQSDGWINTAMPSTASGANVNAAFGTLQLVTSSQVGKNQIADLHTKMDANLVHRLKPRTWHSRWHEDDLGGFDDPDEDFFGFIAEELEVIDRNLVMYPYGPDSHIKGINWNAITAMLVAEIQQLRSDVNALSRKP